MTGWLWFIIAFMGGFLAHDVAMRLRQAGRSDRQPLPGIGRNLSSY